MAEPREFLSKVLDASRRGLATLAVGGDRPAAPGFDAVRSCEVRVQVLATSVALDCPDLFADHVEWEVVSLSTRGVSRDVLASSLEALRAACAEELRSDQAAMLEPYFAAGRDGLARVVAESPPSALTADGPHVDLLRRYVLHLLQGEEQLAVQLALEAAESELGVAGLCRHVLEPAQIEFGRMWQESELHTAEEHLASQVTDRILALLSFRSTAPAAGARRVLLAGAAGDQHALGLKFVAQSFREAGWRVLSLGPDNPSVDLPAAVRDLQPDLFALGVALPRSLGSLVEAVASVRAAFPALPILVGGRPFARVPDLWQRVGADAGAATGDDAVAQANRLVPRP